MSRSNRNKAAPPARLPAVAAAVVLLCAAAGAQEKAAAPGLEWRFERARVLTDADAFPVAFEFELNGYSYRVANNGAGRRVRGAQTRLFNLRLDGSDWIERILFAEYEGNVLLVCGVTDGPYGAGLVVRLEQPSMRARWRAEVPAVNLGPPLRDGGHLYLTGTGFVGKLELETGRFVWRRQELHGRAGEDTFKAFALPELKGDAVLFREAITYDPAKEVTIHNRPAKTLRVHRKTGKILGIE